MNSRELLINTIILQYRDIERGNRNHSIADWVLETVKENETSMGSDHVKDVIKELKIVIQHLRDLPNDKKIERKDLINKLKLATVGEEYMLDIIDEELVEYTDPLEISAAATSVRKKLIEYRRQLETVQAIQEASKDIYFKPGVDARQLAVELIDRLHPLISGNETQVEGLIQSMNFNDIGKLEAVLTQGKETSSTDGIMVTGFKGLNRMCGEENGLRRGDLVCFGALSHNYKSGMLLSLAKQICLYNKPFMIDPEKKPLVVFISLENNVEDNTLLLYRSLKENETGEAVSTQAINVVEAAKYIKERMSVNGYHFEMLRAEPGTYGIRNLIDTLSNFINNGYEIHACVLDYLNLFGKQGCTGGNDAATIRDLFRRVRAYCNPRLITCITAHQLSPEAKFILRQGSDNFVKEVVGKGYWDSCKSIDQELDLEVAIHIEKLEDLSYLTLARGKHRKSTITPYAALYYCQRFHEIGSLLDDLPLENREWEPKMPRRDGGLSEDDESFF